METNRAFQSDEDLHKSNCTSMDPEHIHENISMCIDENEDETGSQTKKMNWLGQQLSKQFSLPDHPVVRCVTYILMGVLIWIFLYLVLHDEVLPNGGLFKLMSLFVLAFLVGLAVSFAKLPPLLGMLITGIVLRAVGFFHVTGVYVQVVILLRNIALNVILIKAGLGLDAPALMKLKFTVLKLGILPCAGEALATGILSYYCLGFPWLWAFLLGFLLSPISPAVVVPTLLNLKERGYGNDKGISTLVIAASSLDDIFSISIFGLLLSSIFSIGSLTMALIRGPLELLMGLILGVGWGFVCSGLPHKDDNCLVLKRSLLIGLGGVAFILGSTSLNYPGAGPLACITAAFVTNISWQMQGWGFDKPNPVAQVYSHLWVMVQPVLFGLIGAEIDVKTLELAHVINSALIVLASLAFRILVCFLSLIGGSLNWKEMLFVNLAWLPKATVQAAFSPQPLDHLRIINSTDKHAYEIANLILTMAVVAIIITAPIGAIAISLTGPYLLNKTEKSTKIAS